VAWMRCVHAAPQQNRVRNHRQSGAPWLDREKS
jgi:hypothetical protein